MAEQITYLYAKLKPLIIRDVAAMVASGGGALSVDPGQLLVHDLGGPLHEGTLPWARVDKTGSSLAQLAARAHSMTTGRDADDHPQYLHLSTARIITARHNFSAPAGSSGPPFYVTGGGIGQMVSGLNAERVGGQLQSVFMRKSADSSLNMNQYLIQSNDGDTQHTLGRMTLGFMAAGDHAGWSHRDHNSSTNYAMIQAPDGHVILNRPAGDQLIFREANVPQARFLGDYLEFYEAVGLKSNDYASQTTGWRMTFDGQLDARYIFTDELHAKVFIADLEQALAGGQIIAKSVMVLSRDFTAPAAGGATTIYLEDLPSAENMAGFQSGDIIRVRTFSRSGGSLTIADCWGVVTSYSNLTGKEQSWIFTRSAAPNAGAMSAGTVVKADAIILDYGTSGNGFYEVNAIDGLYAANSPYAQIVTWTTHPATGRAVRARWGNLNGLGVADYGLRMGTDASNDASTSFDFRANTGAIRLGELGNNKPNLYFDGSSLHLRQNTTALITLDSSGNSFFAGTMTIGTSGEIRQGTGTLGSTFEGIRLFRESSFGKLAAYEGGALNVSFDRWGLDLQQDSSIVDVRSRAISWWADITNRSGEPTQAIKAYQSLTFENFLLLEARGQPFHNGVIKLLALTNGGSETDWTVYSTGTISTNGKFAAGVIDLSPNTGWTDFGGTFVGAQARRFAGFVTLEGVIKTTTTSPSSTLLTLPVGVRPIVKQSVGVLANINGTTAPVRVDIETTGQINAIGGWIGTVLSGDWVSLFGVSYFAA
jgi:hypothetical protein